MLYEKIKSYFTTLQTRLIVKKSTWKIILIYYCPHLVLQTLLQHGQYITKYKEN